MRILDSEAHAIHPRGIDSAYPTHPKWRYPYIPGPAPTLKQIVAESVAKGDFEDVSETLLARMDRHGVEKTILMRGNFPAPNAAMAEIVKRHPDRFVAFSGWDAEAPAGTPPRETAKGLAALERGFTEYGFLGAGEFDLARFMPLPPERAYEGYLSTIELCRRHKKPIMFHTSYDGGKVPMAYKNPIMLEPLAFEYPDVPMLVCHMGKHDVTFFEYAMMLARKCKNVYLTTSNTRRDFIERAVEEIGPERLIFGSDWSMQHGILGERQGFDVYQKNLDAVRTANLDEGEKARILGGNLADLLGI